jgi:hypothetical protein
MNENVRPIRWNPNRWLDLVLDVTVPLIFAVLTAAFFVLAFQ